MKYSLKWCMALTGAMLVGVSTPTMAEKNFPTRPITIIVPYGPGGATDVVGRAIAESMSKQLKQPVVIENKPGAAGSMGVIDMMSAKPDGYRLTLTPVGIFRQPYIQSTRYDPIRDVSYISNFWAYDFAVTVPVDSPIKNIQDLVEAARKKPGEITYGTPGKFTGNHVVLATLGKIENVDFTHVPFKGDAEAISALLGGHTDAAVLANSVLPQLESGKVRVLASADAERNRAFGDVATLRELGYEVYVPSPLGLGGPAGLPQAIVDKLDTAAKEALKDESVKRVMDSLGIRPHYLNSAEYTEFAKKNFASEKEIMSNLNLDD